MEPETQYLRTEEAAEHMGISASYLSQLRQRGTGPVFHQPRKLGLVLYRLADLDTYLQASPHRSRGAAERKERSKVTIVDSRDGEFTDFYAAYPRKEARRDAARAWTQTAAARPPLAELLATIGRQRPGWTDPKYIPLPATWLRGHRWLDEPAKAPQAAGAQSIIERAQKAVRR